MVVERPGLRGRVIAAVGAVDARGGVQMRDRTVKSFKRDASGLGNCTLEFLCRVSGARGDGDGWRRTLRWPSLTLRESLSGRR